MLRIICLISVFTMFSCSDERDCGCGHEYQTTVNVRLLDEQQNDLIESGTFSESDFTAYFFLEGVLNSLAKPTISEMGVRISLNTDALQQFPVTYVRWNNQDVDTLKAQFQRSQNSIILQKLWVNETQCDDPQNCIIIK